MSRILVCGVIAIAIGAGSIAAQDDTSKKGPVPIYRITVVERSLEAVNYQYRSLPTKIDFRGTVLLSSAKGQATVQSQPGRTQIDAKFENLVPPTRFGREYLSYVIWAISPEGSPRNLGEIIPGGSNDAKLRVTTDLPAFGLIVTAEPYSTVRQPSDVVVLENQVRQDTVGKVETIQAKYELLPRRQYTWQGPTGSDLPAANAPKVSMDRYEAILELYQAQNAVEIARAANAEQYAPTTFEKAQTALAEAQRLESVKANSRQVVQSARAAAQTAEDARTIAERRKQDEQASRAQIEATQARHAQEKAEADAQAARAEADAARADADRERAARERGEAEPRRKGSDANRDQPPVTHSAPGPQAR